MRRMNHRLTLVVALLIFATNGGAQSASRCFGTTSNGSLENGWKLPLAGDNFEAYSTAGWLLGRTYVHSQVFEVVMSTFARLARESPDKTYVYGETGKKRGGEFRPHKTHRNGLSVDFMVPLKDEQGHSVAMKTSPLNKWGYGLEFDDAGRLGKLSIDADAMAEHLYQLHSAARRAGIDLHRVIFDPGLQPLLQHTDRWQYLEKHVRFSERQSWVRHDDHYHVDFQVACG